MLIIPRRHDGDLLSPVHCKYGRIIRNDERRSDRSDRGASTGAVAAGILLTAATAGCPTPPVTIPWRRRRRSVPLPHEGGGDTPSIHFFSLVSRLWHQEGCPQDKWPRHRGPEHPPVQSGRGGGPPPHLAACHDDQTGVHYKISVSTNNVFKIL